MGTTYAAVILLSLLSCLTTCLGVVLALALRDNTRAIAAGIGFSAGIMILISLLELIPEAVDAAGGRAALVSAASGAVLTWGAHLVLPHRHLTQERGLTSMAMERSAYLVAFGLILHDVPEGFAMANAYLASPDLGLLVGLGIALHNLPEESKRRHVACPFPHFLVRLSLRAISLSPMVRQCMSSTSPPVGAPWFASRSMRLPERWSR